MPNFYTAGYQGESTQSFFSKLQQNNVNLLIDVRQNPFSFKKGFSRVQLQLLSQSANIKYIHLKDLGTPPSLRQQLKETGNYKQFFEEYSDFLTEYETLIEDLVYVSSKSRICIVCFEKDHTECHRQIIAQRVRFISGNTIDVCHL